MSCFYLHHNLINIYLYYFTFYQNIYVDSSRSIQQMNIYVTLNVLYNNTICRYIIHTYMYVYQHTCCTLRCFGPRPFPGNKYLATTRRESDKVNCRAAASKSTSSYIYCTKATPRMILSSECLASVSNLYCNYFIYNFMFSC